MISADDLKNAQSEISEEELEGAAGGSVNCFHVRHDTMFVSCYKTCNTMQQPCIGQ